MDLLINKRRARRSDSRGVRVDEGVLNGEDAQPTLDAPESRTSEVLLPDGIPSVYCRRCDTGIPLPATRTLSRHPTSGGLITYFRCEEGHADFYFDSGTRFSAGEGS